MIFNCFRSAYTQFQFCFLSVFYQFLLSFSSVSFQLQLNISLFYSVSLQFLLNLSSVFSFPSNFESIEMFEEFRFTLQIKGDSCSARQETGRGNSWKIYLFCRRIKSNKIKNGCGVNFMGNVTKIIIIIFHNWFLVEQGL